ncbi:hypothetical protein HD806DRAFT_419915 [Xylariaceae sp. AK1471]|nr:hypothetical protein HD806DRAFT_419915 [Xylariaceae sp. AK1471]
MHPLLRMAPNTASLLLLVSRAFSLYVETVLITYGITMQYAVSYDLLLLPPSSLNPPLALMAFITPSLSVSYLLNMMLYGFIIPSRAAQQATPIALHRSSDSFRFHALGLAVFDYSTQ